MTLIVGLHLGGYALIAADTRLSFYPNGIHMFRDDEEKIRRTTELGGVISGAGWAELLDRVKERLSTERITVIDRIVEITTETVAHAKTLPGASDPMVVEALKTTGWMFTFIGTDNSTEPPSAVLRLGILGANDTGIRAVQPKSWYLFPPTGTTPEQYEEWAAHMRTGLLPPTVPMDVEAFGKNLAHHVGIVGELMQKVAAANPGVARTFQIGVHIPFMGTAVSNIINEDASDALTFDWDFVDKSR
jgi:hypothetical protein